MLTNVNGRAGDKACYSGTVGSADIAVYVVRRNRRSEKTCSTYALLSHARQ